MNIYILPGHISVYIIIIHTDPAVIPDFYYFQFFSFGDHGIKAYLGAGLLAQAQGICFVGSKKLSYLGCQFFRFLSEQQIFIACPAY